MISNLSGKSTGLPQSRQNQNSPSTAPNANSWDNCSTFENQFKPLEFDHEGLPGTMPGTKQILNIFNDKLKFSPQSNFNPKEDGRYGVTSDMTHDNMQPFFKSRTNPIIKAFEIYV